MHYRMTRSALVLAAVIAATACGSDQNYSSSSAFDATTEPVEDSAQSVAADAERAPTELTSEPADASAASPMYEANNAALPSSSYDDQDAYGSDVYGQVGARDYGSASSNCVGDSSLRTCMDASGNTYTTQRIGDLSYTDGHNARTGSSWSQSTQRIGDISYTTGTDADGNSWNSTTQKIGDTTFQYGTNSDGESFSSTCNEYGCY